MDKTLHITNGDSSVTGMREAGIIGDILPWRDVLHIGPVQNHPTWDAFDQVRIEFLIATKLGDRTYVEQTFSERLSVMNQIDRYEQIYLWFEHDLYDQLQLLQVLMWLAPNMQLHDRIQLIVTDLYLGQATAANFHELFRYSEPLQPQHLTAAKSYWLAFTDETPLLLTELKESVILPFMYPAFNRICREYPSLTNGLNQVQNTILNLLNRTSVTAELFSLYQETEKVRFMGDSIFAQVLENLIHCKTPLLQLENNNNSNVWQNKLTRTAAGTAVLQHQAHQLNINDIKIWIGGVQLKPSRVWCYDKSQGQFKLWNLND